MVIARRRARPKHGGAKIRGSGDVFPLDKGADIGAPASPVMSAGAHNRECNIRHPACSVDTHLSMNRRSSSNAPANTSPRNVPVPFSERCSRNNPYKSAPRGGFFDNRFSGWRRTGRITGAQASGFDFQDSSMTPTPGRVCQQ